MAEARVTVSVVYALPERQTIVKLSVPSDSTIADAVGSSGLLERFPEISRNPIKYAIYGRPAAANERVAHDDRIEILRPLLIDPKESRRQAAARSRRGGR